MFSRGRDFGPCPHCHARQVWAEPNGDLACVTCGWRDYPRFMAESMLLGQGAVDPREPYHVVSWTASQRPVRIA